MDSIFVELDEGKVEVKVICCSGGGVQVIQKFLDSNGETVFVTVTCTCTDSDGKKYSTTKECPKYTGNTSDCTTPSKPKITCG